MTKEELQKAAEEFYNDYSIQHLGEDVNSVDFAIAFHLSQTKKMLEGWTDQEIGFFLQSHDEAGAATEGACIFRDELLKQLEQ